MRDSDGLFGIMSGVGAPLSDCGVSGETSRAKATVGKKVRIVAATIRATFSDRFLRENSWETPSHRQFDQAIVTSLSTMMQGVCYKPTTACRCTPYGRSDKGPLFVPLGNRPNKILCRAPLDRYSAGSHMVFVPWCAPNLQVS